MFAYWYLYAHLAFLLMLPLLRCLTKAMTEREYLWMYALYGILQLLSIIEYLIWKGEHTLNRNAAFFISINTVFYPLLGYYIDRVMDRRFFTGKTLLLLTLASFVGIAVCCMMTLYKRRFTEEMNIPAWETFFYTLNFLPATTAFLAAKMYFMKHVPGERACRILSELGGLTFGIYLFENIYRDKTMVVVWALQPYIRRLPACWVWILTACLLGAAVTFVLKRIPGIRKLL